MKKAAFAVTFALSLMASSNITWAQAPAAAPAGSTGLCKDGSYSTNATKKGACNGHEGVKEWYAAAVPDVAASAVTKPAAAAPVSAPVAAPTAAAKTAMPTAAAAGGGAGQVWVNASSKVYHCMGTKYYGKTNQGEYMTEAAAKKAGNHADHGKACGA